MSILIKGMEMPTEGNWKTIRIYPDGTCAVPNWQGDCTLIKGATAVSIRPHGDLIERDTLAAQCDDPYWCVWLSDIEEAPTVIPAEEGTI